jgi:CheY-like chemotaxis protein
VRLPELAVVRGAGAVVIRSRTRVMISTAFPRILIVDDEPANLRILERYLDETRYRVTTAASGSEALSIIEARGPFDLYVLDVMMPEMRGTALTDAIRARHAGARVLYFTAYSDDLFSGTRVLGENEAFIQKPVTRREVLEAISLILFNDVKGPRG